MKKVIMIGMLLGLLTGVGVAQRGRSAGPVGPAVRPAGTAGPMGPTARPAGTVSHTARPDVDMSRRPASVSSTDAPSGTVDRIRDPRVGSSTTVTPSGTTSNRNVDPSATAPMRDPLTGSATSVAPNSTTTNPNVDPSAAAPIQDPK